MRGRDILLNKEPLCSKGRRLSFRGAEAYKNMAPIGGPYKKGRELCSLGGIYKASYRGLKVLNEKLKQKQKQQDTKNFLLCFSLKFVINSFLSKIQNCLLCAAFEALLLIKCLLLW